jgi:hypothetical protein
MPDLSALGRPRHSFIAAGKLGATCGLSRASQRVCKVFLFSSYSGVSCLFWSLEIPETDALAEDGDLCAPKPAGVQLDTSVRNPSAIADDLVLMVLRVGSFSQIAPFCVCAVAVYMVDLVLWRDSRHVNPRQAMRAVQVPIQANIKVSVRSMVASLFSGVARMPLNSSIGVCKFGRMALTPNKNPGIWVIGKELFNSFCCNIRLSHDALQRLIGQGLAATANRCQAPLLYNSAV